MAFSVLQGNAVHVLTRMTTRHLRETSRKTNHGQNEIKINAKITELLKPFSR
jgi:hypothetical protein